MSDALQALDELTRSRDRSYMDATLVTSMVELLRVQGAAVWHIHGGPGPGRVFECSARQRAGELAPMVGSQLGDEAEPVEADSLPGHLRCVDQGQVVTVETPDGGALTLLPLGGSPLIESVVELHAAQPLPSEQLRLATGVLKICRNFQDLLDYSERDTLTGLFNRKGFDETFLRATVVDARIEFGSVPELERRVAVSQRYWLGVVDIDHFKQVNDRYGHLIGDEVLVLVARLMRSTFRYLDRLYRFGGEEFVILLVAPDDRAAGQAFERLRHNLQNFTFPQVGRVTVSIGFTQVRAGDTPQAAFARADRAVYWAKEHGRNQVAHHEGLVADGAITDETSQGDVELF